jgi:hypothetical protein
MEISLMPFVSGFTPSNNGFQFSNSWPQDPVKVIPLPWGNVPIGDASNGLCGGMVLAARDWFEAGIPAPSGRRPEFGQRLYEYIADRLIDSFNLPYGPVAYVAMMQASMATAAARSVTIEYPKIKADIDSGRLSCLGLCTLYSPWVWDIGLNHQVLAYGYEETDTEATISVYDPNTPRGDQTFITMNLVSPETPLISNVDLSAGLQVRGFHQISYVPMTPPEIDDAFNVMQFGGLIAPTAVPSSVNFRVIVRMLNTGSTTWTADVATPYRLGSQFPQDNVLWGLQRVELPGAVAPRELADFSFTVTAPTQVGPQFMGWRMVRETVQWFGAYAGTSITVGEPAECTQLRSGIEERREQISSLRQSLEGLDPQNAGDRRIIRETENQIDDLEDEILAHQQRAQAIGCGPV